MIAKILILVFFLLLLPMGIGGIYVWVDEKNWNPVVRLLCGQMTLWAGFQMICVPFIIREEPFTRVVILFAFFSAALLLFSLGSEVRHWAERGRRKRERRAITFSGAGWHWLVFWGLLVLQLVQAVRLAYGDGDDAYYVATSTATESADIMYRTSAYTGLGTTQDMRHGLAPFPIWIAFLARVSGIHVATVAHIIMPLVLIPMAYAAFWLIATRLFENREMIPLFMVLTEILVFFGGYSLYTTETFLIARSRQGKAALGSLIIPFLIYLLLLLLKKMEQGEKIHSRYYWLMLATAASACLCSTLGALLCCLLVGMTGLIGFISYRNKKAVLWLAPCCFPCLLFALMYLLLR